MSALSAMENPMVPTDMAAVPEKRERVHRSTPHTAAAPVSKTPIHSLFMSA